MKKISTLLIAILFPIISFAGINLSVTSYSSCGAPTGKIEAYVTGIAPFAYQWSTGSTMPYIDHLLPGTYTLYVTDANGTLDSATTVVADQPFVSGVNLSYFSGTVTQLVGFPCPQQCNGRMFVHEESSNATLPITASLGFGSPNPFNVVSFDNGTNQWVVDNVCEGDIVEVQFVDANGCPGTTGLMPAIGSSYYIDSVNVFPSCLSQATGKIRFFNASPSAILNTVTISGPSGTLVLQLGTVPTTFDNLLPGTYNVTVLRNSSMGPCDSTFNVVLPDLGNNCGMIEGDVIMDSLYNCTIDVNEQPIAGQVVEITPGNFYTTTNASGHFKSFLPYGTYQFRSVGTLGLEPVCTQGGLTLSASNDTISNVVLGDTIKIHIDASVSITMGPIRPGFDHYDYIYVANNSWSDSLNPVVNITYDPLLTLINPSIPYTVVSANEIQFQLPMIAARQGYAISIGYYTPTGILGFLLSSTATLSGVANDEISANNYSVDSRIVTGSFDPNEIIVSPRNDPNNYYFMDIDTAMNYTIYFQNTGTDTAFNIVVVDSLDQHLIPSTFEMLGSSHPCRYDISGQHTLKFYFDNILLPDSNINEPMSHGYVKYKIKPELYLPINPYLISNRADIYFDFNPAVLTNTVVSTMVVSVGLNELSDEKFKVQPNPVGEKIVLFCNDEIGIVSATIVDALGKVMFDGKLVDNTIDVRSFSSGLYSLRVNYSYARNSDIKSSVIQFMKY